MLSAPHATRNEANSIGFYLAKNNLSAPEIADFLAPYTEKARDAIWGEFNYFKDDGDKRMELAQTLLESRAAPADRPWLAPILVGAVSLTLGVVIGRATKRR